MKVGKYRAAEFSVWIDADACPRAVKELLFRTSKRRKVHLVFVANLTSYAPDSELIKVITVPYGADKADDRIVSQLRPGDLVITGDIPLAARAVESGCMAIGFRGEVFDEATIGSRLATRNLMDHLRSAGLETRGPKAFDSRDLQSFANQLDRLITRNINARSNN